MVCTTDLAEFGYREKKMAAVLLAALCEQGLPDGFYDDEVTVMMNKDSGCVFLTNSEMDTAMMNGDRLETWYSCPECGHEGFKEDIDHEGSDDCTRYLMSIGIAFSEEEVEEVTA